MITKIKSWHEIARPEQRIPTDDKWIWLIMAGRGFGKTRTGAESVMELVASGKYKSVAIIGRTIQEARDVMVEGISGLLGTTIAQEQFAEELKEQKKTKRRKRFSINSAPSNACDDGSPPSKPPKFHFYRSRNLLVWENGARAYLIGSNNYERMRGYQFDLVWIDEFAKHKHAEELWQQVLFTLRLGDDPRCIITTTPKPLRLLKRIAEAECTHLTRGTTFDNAVNLSPRFLETMRKTYEHTRVGRQELEGELIMEKENTVWTRKNIVYRKVDRDAISRVVIGVDPAVTSNESSDETGIIVAGLGYDEKMYVLDDLSGKYAPSEWAKVVCRAYHDYNASRIVAETNNGGDLVRAMLTTIYPNAPIAETHAIRGKVARAEPIALLYDANKVYHSREFLELEEQMCDLEYGTKADKSPDRVDALVWALTELKEKANEISHLSATWI